MTWSSGILVVAKAIGEEGSCQLSSVLRPFSLFGARPIDVRAKNES